MRLRRQANIINLPNSTMSPPVIKLKRPNTRQAQKRARKHTISKPERKCPAAITTPTSRPKSLRRQIRRGVINRIFGLQRPRLLTRVSMHTTKRYRRLRSHDANAPNTSNRIHKAIRRVIRRTLSPLPLQPNMPQRVPYRVIIQRRPNQQHNRKHINIRNNISRIFRNP